MIFISVTRAKKIQLDELGIDENPCVLIARNMALERFALQNFGNAPARRHSRGPSVLRMVPTNDVPVAVRRARALSQQIRENVPSPTPDDTDEMNEISFQQMDSPSTSPNESPTNSPQVPAHATRPIPGLIPIQRSMSNQSSTPSTSNQNNNQFSSASTASTPKRVRPVTQMIINRLNMYDENRADPTLLTTINDPENTSMELEFSDIGNLHYSSCSDDGGMDVE